MILFSRTSSLLALILIAGCASSPAAEDTSTVDADYRHRKDAGTISDAGAAQDASTGSDAGTTSDASAPRDAGADVVTSVDSGGGGACLGSALLASLGKSKLLVGGSMQDATAGKAAFDLRYEYLAGGLFDSPTPCTSCASGCTSNGASCANSGSGCGWWGCWQWDQVPPGQYALDFLSHTASAAPPQIPMFTYYEILQTSGAPEGSGEVQATTNVSLMTRYYADWRFLLQKIGSSVAFLHVEPDFWGYAEQMNSNPHAIPSAVASANPTDCASAENSVAGMGQCMIAMARKYAPNAKVALHASAWSTKIDVYLNTDPSLNVAGEAQKTAAFLAACGGAQADLVVVETSDRDAGYYQLQGRNTWWDATNATLPDFHQAFAWVKALAEAMNLPAMFWQNPLGNMSLPNTANAYEDNRVDYFFGHMNELAAAHAIGAAFGAGQGDQTTPESDNGNFVAKANAYYAAGGQSLCP